ncbi:MAG: hypothetical protein RMJ00_04430 [Nitrososphaerota archaeon]|nr:hypothetical protein [Candidatus Bathyarchaeota archaeon]MDW8061926.1 hypothetical protein [Nitrososphaerota archaeon]
MQFNPLAIVEEIMNDFAYRTGISSDLKPRRYLWTDAFAVCNLLELYRKDFGERYKNLALKLIDQVHFILGRHRDDDSRRGWISGLSDEEGFKHPTIGGLRIGKPLPERKPDEPFDEYLEWERDGQYYHYLTRWMYTLNRVYLATGDAIYNLWAIELAKTAHRAFVYTDHSGRKRIYWKMSIDLSYPLVVSMGLHDPLDGFTVYYELQAYAPRDPLWPSLSKEIEEIEGILRGVELATDDPLGIGTLLWDAYTLARLISYRSIDRIDMLADILDAALLSLELYLTGRQSILPSSGRLAFRELGLSIGLKALDRLFRLVRSGSFPRDDRMDYLLESLRYYMRLADRIDRYWLNSRSRGDYAWRKYEDINMVMLATSLAPDGFLGSY